MNKAEKDEFIKNGGTLLKLVKTGKRYTLKRKNITQDWHDGVTNASKEVLQGTIDRLVNSHPTKFQEDK